MLAKRDLHGLWPLFAAFALSGGLSLYALALARANHNPVALWLANGFLVEGPTWAPNGRVLMFFRQQPNSGGRAGSVTLHAIDITGRFERQVPTPTDASDPAWSPLIPQ